jgi:hypothetical protein
MRLRTIVSAASKEYTCLMQSALDQAHASSPRILRSFILANGVDRIVLYDYASNKMERAQNLVCLGHGGRVLWRAQLPPTNGPDCFVSAEARSDGGCIRATTSSCYAVSLDPRNGRIVAFGLTGDYRR